MGTHDKQLLDLQNERNERRERTRMAEIARSLGIPDEGWYISKYRNKDGSFSYRADWTALGLTWLLNMDDRGIRSVVTKVIRSSFDTKGIATGWCRIEFFNGSYYESEGTAILAEASDKGFGYCDEVAETRAFKRAAVRATGKGLIDHPTGRLDDEDHDSITIQSDQGMLRQPDGSS
jgi:hypothetical protein